MKLYTEEQVRHLADCIHGADTEKILASLTPIELPSDEKQIREEAIKEANSNEHSHIKLEYRDGIFYGFIEGAKWMRDKIQGDNNE